MNATKEFTPKHIGPRKGIAGVLLLAVLLPGQDMYAQDLKAALKEMQDKYREAGNLHIVMHIDAFEGPAAPAPFFSEKVDILKQGDNYLFQLNNYDMLYNDAYFVHVNRQIRQISCSKRSIEKERRLRPAVFPDLDSLLSYFDEPEIIGSDHDRIHFRVRQKGGAITHTDIRFNRNTKAIEELRYHYDKERFRGDQYVKIRFEKFIPDPAIEAGTFSESRYIVKSGKVLKPALGYSGYEVLGDNP
ncbi:MAG: hypothetical protein MI975_23195 [Cytophagales bacterium]|nr:hypothetical protein [Cytophagales bacterium]